MEYVSHPLIKPGKIELREYQENIIASCADKNSLVVLPTGLGKTIIAVGVIAHKLHTLPSKRVLVLAPTRPLAEQHEKTLRDLLVDSIPIVLLTGRTPPEQRTEKYREARVVVATPQVIENDILAGRLDLGEYSLVVFDEAHRAVGEYAYTFIARKYLEKGGGQVLGLTASPGGDPEKVGAICGNLGIENVEVRTEQDPDVRPYIKERKLVWIRVDLSPEFREIKALLETAMKKREDRLREMGIVVDSPTKTRLLELQRELSAKISAREADGVEYGAVSEIAAMLKISHGLELLQSQGVSQFYKYASGLGNSNTRAVKSLLQDPDYKRAVSMAHALAARGEDHPKVPSVIEILEREVRDGKKAIVFAQYVHTVRTLVEKIREETGLRVAPFIGQRRGHTQRHQKATIEAFRRGEYDVLVSTSIGEEGLDIPRVDVVVFYEPVPSEIRSIQRRGRTGRGDAGKVFVLIARGTIDEAYYWSSRHKEARMRSTLEKIRSAFGGGTVRVLDGENRKQPSGMATLDSFASKTQKNNNKNLPLVVLDHREKELARALEKEDVELRTTTLDVGDAVLSDRVVVERKTDADFVQSMIDGRLFRQALALASTYWRPLIVIEGKNLYTVRNVHPNAILGAISSLVIDYRIPIVYTRDARETARLLALIARREQLGDKRDVRLRESKKSRPLSEIQEYIVAGFPDIDASLSRRILSHFGTIKNFVNAGIEDLLRVDGIGRERAMRIKKIIEEEYEEPEEL